jgi:hypothetical protein
MAILAACEHKAVSYIPEDNKDSNGPEHHQEEIAGCSVSGYYA